MQRIDVTELGAEDGLTVLAWHLPEVIRIGTPRVVMPDQATGGLVLLTDDREDPLVWWVSPWLAERLATLPDGRVELTKWRNGEELSRTIADPNV